MNENEKKQYLDDDGMLFYTQRLKIVLDTLLAGKADNTTVEALANLVDGLDRNKVDKVPGKGLSTNDLTDALVQKIDEAGRRATIDGHTIEGDLTKDELDIAAASALQLEVNTRTSQINEINNTKIVNIAASNGIIPIAESAKIPESAIIIVTNTNADGSTSTVNQKNLGITWKDRTTGKVLLIITKTSGRAGLYTVEADQAIDLNDIGVKDIALIDADDWETDYKPLLDAFMGTSPSSFASASDFNNLSNNVYRKNEVYTKGETNSAIATAIAGVTQIKYEIVQELPQEGVDGVIYLIKYAETPQGNVYQEWIWISNSSSYETLGSTNQIDLSNYVTFDDIEPISNNTIQTIYNNVFDSGRVNVTLNFEDPELETPLTISALSIKKEVSGEYTDTVYELPEGETIDGSTTIRLAKNSSYRLDAESNDYGSFTNDFAVSTSDISLTFPVLDEEPGE